MNHLTPAVRRRPVPEIQKTPAMPAKHYRIVFGATLRIARVFGWTLIALAALGIPQMQLLLGPLATGFGLLSSVMLGLAGIAWLVGVKVFLLFFDRYLSRN